MCPGPEPHQDTGTCLSRLKISNLGYFRWPTAPLHNQSDSHTEYISVKYAPLRLYKLPDLTQHKVPISVPMFKDHQSGKHSLGDASSKGDTLSKGRNISDFLFGDTPVGDEITVLLIK